MSVGIDAPAPVETDRPTGLPRSARGVPTDGGQRRVRVAIVGATGYVGAELIRILARHPNVELVGLQGRDRDQQPIEDTHRHLVGTGLTVEFGAARGGRRVPGAAPRDRRGASPRDRT